MKFDGPEVGAHEVRDALRRILGSADFEASERNRRFLSFIVEETLAGRSDRIKAYAIATRVFNRSDDFDPQMDSIVRIEAGRLRRALEHYYLASGNPDPLRLSIPKGSYIPAFDRGIAGETSEERQTGIVPPSRDRRRGCTLFVAPFDEDGDHAMLRDFTRGFTRQVIIGLTRFKELFVFGGSTTFTSGTEADRARLIGQLDADFVLSGATSLSETHFSVDVLLVDARTGQYIWGETFARDLRPGEIVQLRDFVAEGVVRSLAQPYGVLFSRALETDGSPPERMTSYDSVVRFHLYWQTYDPDLFDAVRAGLERTIVTDPDYAEAFACLSQIYSNAARFGHDTSDVTSDPLKRAMVLARQAINLAPRSSRGHHALGLACWFSGDLTGSLAALEKGLALNPNDSEIMADLGLRCALRADWDRGVPLLEDSYARNPAQPGPYRIGLALYHFAHNRNDQAIAEAKRTDAAGVVYGHLMEAAAAARSGRWQDAEVAVKHVTDIAPGYFTQITDDLTKRNLHPELIEMIVDAVRNLGQVAQEKMRK